MVAINTPSPSPANNDQSSVSKHRSYERVLESYYISGERGFHGLRDFVSSVNAPLQINYEHLVELLGDAQQDTSEFGRWVFHQAATILASVRPDSSLIDNNDWSHATLYLFRASCFHPLPRRSVLDDKRSLTVAEELINRAVQFCEASESMGSTPVILRGIIASNLRAWAATGDITSFAFHPESLRSARFKTLLAGLRQREVEKSADISSGSEVMAKPHALNEYFCMARTPEEFLLPMFLNKGRGPLPHLDSRLRSILLSHLGERRQNYPSLNTLNNVSSLDEQRLATGLSTEESSQITLEPRRGVYVDVFGTLIDHEGKPNLRLAQMVKDLMAYASKRPVYLVSDSQEEEVKRVLVGVFDQLPPILRKSTLQGQNLEFVVDTCEPEPQGFYAATFLQPSQAIEWARHVLSHDEASFPG